ncbi:IclR family transcriptional regulator [Terrabacter terrigena]|uniref:IclR family transcriptional regulator n=1 Tax=Terrabacter terrigena TaxID=574718 RepID=A0ABW3N3P7_9MICO
MNEQPMGILEKASRLVELLAERGPMTPAEIAEETGMPRPSVYRLAEALHLANLATILEDSRIQASHRWLRLADASRSAMGEWAHARGVLDDLREQTGQTVFLSVPRHHEAICIDWAQGRAINVLLLKPGRRLPLHAGAAGRVTLAFHEEAADYVDLAPFPPLTRHTLTTANELRRDIELTRARRYVHSDEDVTDGIGALGIPVFDGARRLRGALSLAGLAEDMSEREESFVTRLLRAGDILSDGLDSP